MTPEAIPRRFRFQATLAQLSQLRPTSFDGAVRAILSALAENLAVERASFWRLDPDLGAIRCVSAFNASSATFESGAVLEREKYPAYFEALLTCGSIVASDATNDARTREFAVGYFDLHGIGAMLDVPVWNDGALAGVLCCEHVGGPRQWTSDEEHFARAAANLVALGFAATERARAEERLLVVSRASGDVSWEWDFASDVIEWSERLEAAFGHPVTEESRGGEWWSAHVHPGDRARVLESIEATIREGRSAWQGEYRFQRADGTFAFVVDRGFVTYDEGGHAIRMTGVLQDVSDRKALEERLLVADRMASLGTLAAGVAHEINNPLTYVKGNIEHVRAVLGDAASCDPDVLHALDEAITGADRIRRIVTDLSMFTRAGGSSDVPVDLDQVVESALAIAQRTVSHEAKVTRRLGSPPRVRGNEARLAQVVLNLVINATHAVRDVTAAEIIITTRVHHETSDVVLEVSDNGTGIDAQTLPRIFDPFFTTKRVGEGTGLGLWISHSIVSSLGGGIQVESTPGVGTTFRITLPCASPVDTATTSTVSAPTTTKPVGSRPKVLVVDDEPAVRTLAKRILASDYDVEIVDGAAAAFERLSAERFDAILCDVIMPEQSGLDVYAKLVASQPELARRFVFMTGGAVSERARQDLEGAGRPLVAKPFDRDELHRAVRDAAAQTRTG